MLWTPKMDDDPWRQTKGVKVVMPRKRSEEFE